MTSNETWYRACQLARSEFRLYFFVQRGITVFVDREKAMLARHRTFLEADPHGLACLPDARLFVALELINESIFEESSLGKLLNALDTLARNLAPELDFVRLAAEVDSVLGHPKTFEELWPNIERGLLGEGSLYLTVEALYELLQNIRDEFPDPLQA